MAQDKPAPPAKPNACLSKYERAIIATYNDITTADFNGGIHWRELIERASAKGPAPQRLPKNPLVLPDIGAGKKEATRADLAPSPKGENATSSPAFDDFLRAAATQDLRTDEEWDKAAAIRKFSDIALLEIPVDIKTMPGYRKPPVEFDAISRGIGIPPHWITNDFIYHYFFGRGQMVDLRWVNLGVRFEQMASVIALVEAFVRDTFPEAKEGFKAERHKKNDVSSEGPLFSVGGHWFRMEVECDSNRCLYHFFARDVFKDPLDIGFEVGGTPYEIKYDFYRAFRLPSGNGK